MTAPVPAPFTNQFGQRRWEWFDAASNTLTVWDRPRNPAVSIEVDGNVYGVQLTPGQCAEVAAVLHLLASERADR
jgi:hypothetical protein